MAITSPTDICNLALDLLSAGTVQDVENPTNPTEEILNRWYDHSRRKALREHPWNFAVRRKTLSASATAPAFGYAKAFPMPANFLRVLYISTDLATDQETVLPTSAYQFEGGSILITNTYGDSTVLNLVYVADITTVSQFDPMFIDLLAHDIAISCAYKLTESNTNIDRLARLARQRSIIAKAIDGQERPPERVERSKAISARNRRGKK